MTGATGSDTFTVTVEKLLYGGDALARHDGKAVFIPFAVPGDCLRVRPVAEKKNFIRAEISEIISPGTGRVAPRCRYFTRCGGCDWQQLEYARQIEAKRAILTELCRHRYPETGRLAIDFIPCPQPFAYRSRARVQVGGGATRAVGFFRSGSHQVEAIDSCPLFRPQLDEALRALRRHAPTLDRDLAEVNLAAAEEDCAWVIGQPVSTRRLRRRIAGFTYTITADTFFQANDFIAGALLDEVVRLAASGDVRQEAALDLYAGAGFFSLPLARYYGTVTAVEVSRAAWQLGRANAAAAGLDNWRGLAADVAAWLYGQAAGQWATVVLDPPRTGVSAGVMEQLDRLAPRNIVYVSCDPQTLLRDLDRLDVARWRIAALKGFDMFPQTYHFETVAHLVRR